MKRGNGTIKKIVIFIVIFAAAGGAAYWQRDAIAALFNSQPQSSLDAQASGQSAQPAPKVIVQPVVMMGNDRVFEAVGTGRARLSVQIYPAVSEEVMDIYFQSQDRVKKGDVLVQLDDREEQLAVRLAEVNLKDARSLLDRYEKAVQQGGVPESEVDAARAEFESAQVALDQAKLDLEQRQIIAPFDGVVGIPNVDAGDRVNPNTMITGLDDRAILHVDFEVPEALAGVLQREGTQTVTATTPAFPGRTFTGTITAQESRLDPRRRTLKVRANIENPDDQLRPGMSFSTRWEVAGDPYPTAPEISLQWGRDGSYLWIVRDGKGERIPVTVVARSGGRILVEGDITENDDVVVEGVQRLRPGIAVEVLGTVASPAAVANETDFQINVESASGNQRSGSQ